MMLILGMKTTEQKQLVSLAYSVLSSILPGEGSIDIEVMQNASQVVDLSTIKNKTQHSAP